MFLSLNFSNISKLQATVINDSVNYWKNSKNTPKNCFENFQLFPWIFLRFITHMKMFSKLRSFQKCIYVLDDHHDFLSYSNRKFKNIPNFFSHEYTLFNQGDGIFDGCGISHSNWQSRKLRKRNLALRGSAAALLRHR